MPAPRNETMPTDERRLAWNLRPPGAPANATESHEPAAADGLVAWLVLEMQSGWSFA